MSTIIDKKFIGILSPQLERFAWKRETLANCRCPICGDSEKNKSKCRGYFYQKENGFFYKCHNCGYGSNVYNFLKEVSPSLCKEYNLEKFKESATGKRGVTKEMLIKSKPNFKPKDGILDGLLSIDKLDKNHPAREFVKLRQIPKSKWDLLYYTDDFGSFMKKVDPSLPAGNYTGKEPRLVIPFYNKENKVVAAQGRAINFKDEANARSTAKYLTVKSDKTSDRLWYGQWRVDPKKTVYIVEGPLDSLFIPNCIAMVGAGALDQIPPHLQNSDGIYALDNEPRNKQIVMYNERLIELGKTVCIWPEHIKEKDINDMIFKMSPKQIEKTINENAVSGLEAKLKLNQWRRI